MKVLGITSIRSEYDLMSSFYRYLNDDIDIEIKLLVGGAHHSHSFGYTMRDIEKDGFDFFKVESLLDSDSNLSRLKSASILLLTSLDFIAHYEPDIIIYAGDREEVLLGGMIGGYLNIPTIHFFAGDHAADGHIDNPVRHAASKLSSLHFVSTDQHKERLRLMGEPEGRIHTIGSVALDKFHTISKRNDILNLIAKSEISKPGALLIFHPVEEEKDIANLIIRRAVNALISEGFHVFIGAPNSDHGNRYIRDEIDQLKEKSNVTVYGNLPREEFVQLFKECSIIVGNSSAGILEAASVPIPCVNIGERQRGRYCGENVIFVDTDQASIQEGIKKAKSVDFAQKVKGMVNPYGDGKSSFRAYQLIKELKLSDYLSKREDPLSEK